MPPRLSGRGVPKGISLHLAASGRTHYSCTAGVGSHAADAALSFYGSRHEEKRRMNNTMLKGDPGGIPGATATALRASGGGGGWCNSGREPSIKKLILAQPGAAEKEV
jgi:hypothetical protein